MPWIIIGALAVAVAYLTVLTVTTVVAALSAGGWREEDSESADALAASRLTIPVSVIVPAGDAPSIERSIRDLLQLNYPEFEVIVVVDQPAAAVEAIEDEWALESVEFFYRRTLDTSAVRRIFRSGRDPRLMVIEKEPGHPSDGLNVGVNVARYRFVATVPPGATFDHDALLRAMSPALDDPRTVVGVFCPLEPELSTTSRVEAHVLRLRSIRASMMARLFKGVLSRHLDGHGVRLWRRDAVVNAGGFARNVVCPDLELAMRVVQDSDCRVVCSLEPFGVAPASAPQPTLWRDTHDRQLTALEVLRRLQWRDLPGVLHRSGALLEAELVTPLARGSIVALALVGAALGVIGWPAALSCVVLLAFGTAVVSAAGVLLAGSSRNAPGAAEVRALLWSAPFEAAVLWPRLAHARLTAFFESSAHV